MKRRVLEKRDVGAELEALQARLRAAQAESKRAAAARTETRRKLDMLGRQLAELKARLESATEDKARRAP